MAGYLLDTNHLTAALKPGLPVREHIRAVKSQGARVGVCIPALCELQV